MTEPVTPPPAAAAVARVPEPAVLPRNAIDQRDIAEGAAAFDRWLQNISGNVITLSRLQTLASTLPVLSNVLALVDVLGDLVDLYNKGPQAGIDDWFNLGVDLIGVIPGAGGPARIALRPALHALKKELPKALARLAKATGKASAEAIANEIAETVVALLLQHVNDSLVGEIETFAAGAQARLEGFANDCADLVDKILDSLIDALKTAAGERQTESLTALVASGPVYKPGDTQLGSLLAHVVKMQQAMIGEGTNLAARVLMPAEANARIKVAIAGLTDIKGQCRGKLKELVSAKAEKGLHRLLQLLKDAALARLAKTKKKASHNALVEPDKKARAEKQRPGEPLEASAKQAKATQDSDPCKRCPSTAATPGSISYVTGAETITHTDFVLQAPLPIEWSRTYRSNLAAYDQGSLGARWLTPYGSRVDVIDDRDGGQQSLRHHGADGRSHNYPWLPVGHQHFDPIEEVTLTRHSERLLIVDFGKPMPSDMKGLKSLWREQYELVETCAGKQDSQGRQHFRLISVLTPEGATLGMRYDHTVTAGPFQGEQVLSDVISREGGQVRAHAGLQLDGQGRIHAVWEIRAGQLLRQLAGYKHDDAGDLIQAQDENAAAWQYRYSDHLLTRYNDRTGRGMNLVYDGSSADAKAIREWADDGSQDTRLQWDTNIRLTYVTDALGQETRVYYDILGYPYRTIHPDQTEEWFFRDDAKNVTQHLRRDGSSDRYAYDAHGNLSSHERPDGSTVAFEYDAAHRLITITDPEGGRWQRSYDDRGQLTEEADPRGLKTAYAYDDAGRPVHIVDAKGGNKRLSYTPQGQLASYTDCSGRTSEWQYDERGRLTASIDAMKHRTELRYTPVNQQALADAHDPKATRNFPGQLQAIVHPDGTEDRLCHDAEGRLMAHADALERHTVYRYAPNGQIAQRTDANGHKLNYQWDKLGRLTELRNENGQPYTFEYDPAGRLLQERGFDGKLTEYRYASTTGVLEEVIDGQARTKLEFDAMGRLTKRQASAAGSEQTETFGYNRRGQLAEAGNEHAKLAWFYDEAGNLIREHQEYLKEGQTAVWQHRYNELNQRTGTTRPGGHTLEWLTYGSGHVHGLVLDGHDIVGFERDALHREVHRQQGNGVQQVQRYDPVGRLLEQHVSRVGALNAGVSSTGLGGGGITRTYRYDRAGQLTGIADSRRGALDYRYDPVGRLLAATSALGHETFAFDAASNIIAPEQRGQKLLDNLLKDYAGTHYRYDERGNMVHRLHNGEVSRFEWDALNRMVKAITPQGVTTFAYDPLGRRIAKHSPKAKTLFGWDGDTLAFESSDERSVHYVHEAGSFVPLAQVTRQQPIALAANVGAKDLIGANGRYDIELDPLWNGQAEQPTGPGFGKEEITYYQCDHLGTPMELTDHQGNIAWAAQYKAWGAARGVISDAARKAGISNPIRFQGQYFDEETGLHYNRYRYYDPGSGRFVSSDPVGLEGGSNLHLYAPNSTEWIDPLGLNPRCRYDPNMSQLEKMAHSIHGESLQAGRSPRAFNNETIAVAVLEKPDGSTETVAASSRGKLTRAQQGKAEALGTTPVRLGNVTGPEGHAERNIINRYAEQHGYKVREIAASRPICCGCADAIREHKARPVSPLKRTR